VCKAHFILEVCSSRKLLILGFFFILLLTYLLIYIIIIIIIYIYIYRDIYMSIGIGKRECAVCREIFDGYFER
jgi:hypothetical protein